MSLEFPFLLSSAVQFLSLCPSGWLQFVSSLFLQAVSPVSFGLLYRFLLPVRASSHVQIGLCVLVFISLRALFWQLPLDGDGDLLSERVEVPDPIGVVSSSESVSTNSRDLYLVSRPVSCIESPLLASSTSAAVAGVPSGRQLCLVIR